MEHVLEKLGRSYKRRDENLGSARKAGDCQLPRGTAREGARPQRPPRDAFRKTGQRGAWRKSHFTSETNPACHGASPSCLELLAK